MSRAVIPIAPQTLPLTGRTLPSHLTFSVNPKVVYSPSTGYPWLVEMDHKMQNLQMYSLVPQKNDNQYVSHYRIESRRPRFIGDFKFSDAWITTNHHMAEIDGLEVHVSQTLFCPVRTNNRLYFDKPPHHRIEIIAYDRFIGDREILEVLEKVLPLGTEIQHLLQCQS
jgi:hypothetical protein